MTKKVKQLAVLTPLYFFGLKHCGKTTLGRLTAQALSLGFFDADDILSDYLSSLAGYTSMTIREFYHLEGKNRFQELEYLSMTENLKDKIPLSVTSLKKNINYLYALGGGVCDNTRLMRFLKQTSGTFFYIKQDEKILLNRILKRGVPPFLDSKNPEESFHELYIARSEIYTKQADYIIDISGNQSIEVSLQMIITYLNKLNTLEK